MRTERARTSAAKRLAKLEVIGMQSGWSWN
jgi:hypothetical protein